MISDMPEAATTTTAMSSNVAATVVVSSAHFLQDAKTRHGYSSLSLLSFSLLFSPTFSPLSSLLSSLLSSYEKTAFMIFPILKGKKSNNALAPANT